MVIFRIRKAVDNIGWCSGSAGRYKEVAWGPKGSLQPLKGK